MTHAQERLLQRRLTDRVVANAQLALLRLDDVECRSELDLEDAERHRVTEALLEHSSWPLISCHMRCVCAYANATNRFKHEFAHVINVALRVRTDLDRVARGKLLLQLE
jgi:hypothetical protein